MATVEELARMRRQVEDSMATRRSGPRQYHVVLVDGERTVTASRVTIENGALSLEDTSGDTKVTYAAGQWKYVELESQDESD